MAEWKGWPVARPSAQTQNNTGCCDARLCASLKNIQLRVGSVAGSQSSPDKIKPDKHVESFRRICLDRSSTLLTSTCRSLINGWHCKKSPALRGFFMPGQGNFIPGFPCAVPWTCHQRRPQYSVLRAHTCPFGGRAGCERCQKYEARRGEKDPRQI